MLFILILGSIVCWNGRACLFKNIGEFLLFEEKPKRSDVTVVLRGDRNYRRVMEAARFFHNGYSNYIYISTALIDKSVRELNKHGVELPSEQERLKSILIQRAVPEDKIIMGYRDPGGGTLGEANRIKAMMLERSFDKAIIVTNWWHTKRMKNICEKVFDRNDIRVSVVAAKNDITDLSNWWKYRYEAIHLLEEFPKLLIFFFLRSSNLAFSDDPPK